MRTPQLVIVSILAFLLGAISIGVFTTLNYAENDTGPFQRFGWFLLCPSAFILAVYPRTIAGLGALALLPGVFVGGSMSALLAGSNIWPIAGAFVTAFYAGPVVAGTLVGAIVGWGLRRFLKVSNHRTRRCTE